MIIEPSITLAAKLVIFLIHFSACCVTLSIFLKNDLLQQHTTQKPLSSSLNTQSYNAHQYCTWSQGDATTSQQEYQPSISNLLGHLLYFPIHLSFHHLTSNKFILNCITILFHRHDRYLLSILDIRSCFLFTVRSKWL